MEEKVCILYGKNHFTALRLEELFKNNGFKFLYSKSHLSLKEHIALAKNNLLCILVEIDNNAGAIELIEDAKASSDSIPLIVLSDDPRRDLFIKAILAGANDFIVKPFQEDLLLDRVSALLKKSPDDSFSHNETALEMIRIELKKSQMGKYPLKFGLITFFKPVKAYNAQLEQRYRTDLPKVFSDLGSSLFDTDVKQLIGSQSMLVALTFCQSMQIPYIEKKITELYKKLKLENSSLKEYLMAQIFISEFADDIEPVYILDSLMNQTKQIIVDLKGEFK